MYFSIVLNLIGFLPAVPDEELPVFYPIFGKIRHGLRIITEATTVALLVLGAIFYAILTSLKSLPLAHIGAPVLFAILA
jgi:hypothetical protein